MTLSVKKSLAMKKGTVQPGHAFKLTAFMFGF
jgi:hypothetical protein